MGEETSVQCSRKKHLKDSCKAVNNSNLTPEEAAVRVHPEAFQSIQLDLSRIFDVSKQTSASC